jgi:hypothetical protein
MYKCKVKDGKKTVTMEDSNGFLHEIVMGNNTDDAILRLVGTMYTLYTCLAGNKQLLKNAIDQVKLILNPQTEGLKHLADPTQLFAVLMMLDVQGYTFETVSSDLAVNMLNILKEDKGFTLMDAMALYWAKLAPELLKKCPRYMTDDKFQYLYSEASKRGASPVLILQEIVERKDYDVKAAVKQHVTLSPQDEEVVDDVLETWEQVHNQIQTDLAAKKKD